MAIEIALGSLALISIVKDCSDLYLMFSAAKSLHKDAELFETKLDAERMLFSQWADRVGLAKARKWDTRLDDQGLNKAVAGVLSSIKTLLGDAEILESRYGLERRDLGFDKNSFAGVNLPKAKALRMKHIFQTLKQVDFNKSTLDGGKKVKNPSVMDRCCWVVRDKDKFERLLQELHTLNSQLHGLVPDSHIQRLKQILKAASGIPYVLEAVKRANRTAD
ncbi:hypothetical protein Neosp_003502 [[Neocosmospora] mangrovei]